MNRIPRTGKVQSLVVMENDIIDVFHLIAERKIVEAMENGEFDHLPGKGQPLHLSGDLLEPPDQRLANKILKTAGIPPLEVSLRRELAELKKEYSRTKRSKERRALLRDIRLLVLRINLMRQGPVLAEATEAIADQIDAGSLIRD